MKSAAFQGRRLALAIALASSVSLAVSSPATKAEISFLGATQENFLATALEVVLGTGMSRDSGGLKPMDTAQTHVRLASSASKDQIDSTAVFGTGVSWWDMNGPGVFDANGNGYYLQRNGSEVKMFEYAGGMITQLGKTIGVNGVADDTATIAYEKSSGKLKGIYNGSVILQETTSTFAGADLSPGLYMKWGNSNLARISSFESSLEEGADESTDTSSTVTVPLTGPAANPFMSSELETVLGAGMKISPDGVKPRTQKQTHVRSTRPSHSKTLTASTSFGNGVLWWDMNGPGLFDADGNGYYLQRNGNKVELFQYANDSAISLASPVAVSIGAKDTSTLELDSATGKLVGRYNGSVVVETTVSPTDLVDVRPGLFMKWSNSNSATLTSVDISTGSSDAGNGGNPGSGGGLGSNPKDIKPYTYVGPKPVITDVASYKETRILEPDWTYEENFSSSDVKSNGFFTHLESAWPGVHPTDSAAAATDGDGKILVLKYAPLGKGDSPEDAWSELKFKLPFRVEQLEMSYDLYLPKNYVASEGGHKGFVFWSGTYGGTKSNVFIANTNWPAGHAANGATPALNIGINHGNNMGMSHLTDNALIYKNNSGEWQRVHVYIELAKEPGDFGRVEVFSNGKLITGTSHPKLLPRDYAPVGNKQLSYTSSGNYIDQGYLMGWMDHKKAARGAMFLGVDNFKIKVRSTVGATNNSPVP
ncbi:hypothetical protein [Allohahella sp. A8]|uniref:hypothetical protein n=1 Tax=Allohahella sp. A8 TaxID=3141461 RepID=UPI003A808A93